MYAPQESLKMFLWRNGGARNKFIIRCFEALDAQKHISSKEQIESSAQGKENEDHKKLKPKELKSSEKKVKAETSEKKPLKEKKKTSIFSKLKKLTSKK